MTILPLAISRFFELAVLRVRRWEPACTTAKLEALSDSSLQDIGIEPCRRDFDAVKPFWMA
jgi:uncharacterized protein YjiS (DUF1127 family)